MVLVEIASKPGRRNRFQAMVEAMGAATGTKKALLMYSYLVVYILLSSGQIFFNKVGLSFYVCIFAMSVLEALSRVLEVVLIDQL